MKALAITAAAVGALAACAANAQGTFEITGTPIPSQLLTQNYGNVPKGITGYDLNICNISEAKQSLTSSKVYQALMQADSTIQPVGRAIMLASILRNQSRSWSNILSVTMSSATSLLSILGPSSFRVPSSLGTGIALSSITGQQVLAALKPALSVDELEKFEGQVLEPAVVMDSGSCLERTVFTLTVSATKAKIKPKAISFHVR